MFLPALSLAAVLVYLTGFLNLQFVDRDQCAMTYMFEYPQYVRIPVKGEEKFPGYALYAYSEGRLTERARKMWFDGVPVLFLPGNSGSHMQARSLASVALRMGLSKGTGYHFDYFTISFNEDISAFDGGVLGKQVAYASKSVQAILALYKDNPHVKIAPSMVIIIGHSMGGVIAKRLIIEPEWINQTSLVINLAAPLVAPVINIDEQMDDFYLTMDRAWNVTIRNNEELKDKKFLLSFGGGAKDLQVPSGLIADNDSYISALTTAIPGVWLSTDHVGIVWCKQLMLTINRFLFSIIDRSTEQVHEDMALIKSKAKLYFVSNRSMTYNLNSTHANTTMIPDAFWYEDNRRVYQISRPAVEKTSYLMIRLVNFPQNRFAAIEAVNVSDKDWIFGCNAKEVYHKHRYCKTATSLSQLSRWTGSASHHDKRKLATINLHDLSKKFPDWTHVVVKISPTRKPVTLNVDVNDHASRVITVDYISLLHIDRTVIVNRTEPGTLYYEIKLKDFKHSKQVYLLFVEPLADCKGGKYHVSAEVHIPWAENFEYYYYFTDNKSYTMTLRLLSSKLKAQQFIEEHVTITVLLDPKCSFKITMLESWHFGFAEIVRNYTPALIPYMAGILLLALRNTLINIEKKGVAMSVHKALNNRVIHPFLAVPSILAMSLFFKLIYISLEETSFVTAAMKNGEIFEAYLELVPMSLIYVTALGLMHMVTAFVQSVLIFSSQTTNKLFFRIVWAGAASIGERVETILLKVPFVVSLMLIVTAGVARGAASLVIGAAFYAFMLSKTYEEYFEDYVYKMVRIFAIRLYRGLFGANVPNSPEHNIPIHDPTTEDNSSEEAKPTDEADVNAEQIDVDAEPKFDEKIDENDNGERALPQLQFDVGYDQDMDEKWSACNFHLLLFLLWLLVTAIHIPALVTWARYFNNEPILPVNMCVIQHISMGLCTLYLFQMKAPKKNLSAYNTMITMLLIIAIIVLTLGPTSLYIVGQMISIAITFIVCQQVIDKPVNNQAPSVYFDDDLDLYTHLELVKKQAMQRKKKERAEKIKKKLLEARDAVSALRSTIDAGTTSSAAGAVPAEPAPADLLPNEPQPDEPLPTEPRPDEPLPTEPRPDEQSPDPPSPDASAPGPSTSTNDDQPDNNAPPAVELDENSVTYKIKVLKEKFKFLDQL